MNLYVPAMIEILLISVSVAMDAFAVSIGKGVDRHARAAGRRHQDRIVVRRLPGIVPASGLFRGQHVQQIRHRG